MPAPICIMASVMMKDGMPILGHAEGGDERRAEGSAASARMIADAPGSGRLAMLTLASCSVKKATTMPVALATAGDGEVDLGA